MSVKSVDDKEAQEDRHTRYASERRHSDWQDVRRNWPVYFAMLIALSAAQVSIVDGGFAWRVVTGCTLILIALVLLGLYLRLPQSRFRSYLPPLLFYLMTFAGMPLGVALPHVLHISHLDRNAFMAFMLGGFAAGGFIGGELFKIAMRHDLRLERAEAPAHLLDAYLAQQNLGVGDDGLVGHLAPSGEDDVPRLYAMRDRSGVKHFVTDDEDLPPNVRAQLQALPPAAAFDDPEAVAAILDEDEPSEDVWRAHVYIFPDFIGPHEFPDAHHVKWKDRHLCMQLEPVEPEAFHQPMFAVIIDGQITSLCCSRSAGTGLAHEAYVYTRPEFRRRGYGRQVCLAWAHHLQQDGVIPFFSHAADDEAAATLAHSLRLIFAFDDVAYY